MLFAHRTEAGQRLAERLTKYAGEHTAVMALPRGGVPVAYEVARALFAPLDVFVVRKLGVPGHEELAMGAIASGGVRVLNEDTIAHLQIDRETVESVTRAESIELQRREAAYRDGMPAQNVEGKTVILVDDGLATGASMYAAILAMRARRPKQIVVGVPVAPPDSCAALSRHVDEMVCVAMPEPFRGVGAWYGNFTQVSDDEVREMLRAANG